MRANVDQNVFEIQKLKGLGVEYEGEHWTSFDTFPFALTQSHLYIRSLNWLWKNILHEAKKNLLENFIIRSSKSHFHGARVKREVKNFMFIRRVNIIYHFSSSRSTLESLSFTQPAVNNEQSEASNDV